MCTSPLSAPTTLWHRPTNGTASSRTRYRRTPSPSSLPSPMSTVQPLQLEAHGVPLEPLTPAHADALPTAASDGRLWELWYTAVPEPERVEAYIEAALTGQRDG